KKAGLPEPNAMAVCSVDASGHPSQRMVLMKHCSPERGLIFYTNYGSRKARELDVHPQCALLFHQHILQRQIRVRGHAVRASREESEAYFKTRPRSSQLGAWTSRQSEVLDKRETFEQRFAEVSKRFEGQEVPCPEFWGGFRVIPESFEFWQGRAYRLHDRFVYTRKGETWERVRLYP
ncbi:MAG: pyridoxamine 5'-phosphate oxidase, partial [Kiritimatiellia bacterium]